MQLVWLLLAGFALSALAPGLYRLLGKTTERVLALLPAAATLYLLAQVPTVSHGKTIASHWSWLPGLDVNLALQLDGLSLLFSILITGIGALIVLYSGSYLEGHAKLGRFYMFLLLFMTSMLGVAMADDIIALFVFWELTSLSSYFLIGFEHEHQDARRNALQALLVTGFGGLALLAGLILMAIVTGTNSLSGTLAQGELLRDAPLYAAIFTLVVLGAFTKSAQVPFHFWLPGAMVAPTPVSAYLHSATMVKAGVYLLARVNPGLGGTTAWTVVLGLFGTATLVTGAVLALRQVDLKLVLAYTTVAALGAMTLLIGIGTSKALLAAMAVLLAHALYKGALFMVAGAIDHSTGTRDLRNLGGLRKAMPWTAMTALIAALSFAGMLPLFGFIAKESMLAALLHRDGSTGLVVLAGTLIGLVLLVVAAARVGVQPFWGKLQPTPHSPHEAPWALRLGPLVLALCTVGLGLAPAYAGAWLVDPASSAAAGQTLQGHLALWHGLAPEFLLGLAILGTGAVMYWRGIPSASAASKLGFLDNVGPQAAYTRGLAGFFKVAKLQARLLQNGRVRIYLRIIFAVATFGGLLTLLRFGVPSLSFEGFDVRPHELLFVILLAASALAMPFMQSRLGAVAVLGVVGYSIAVVFILFGAPDLAMTQFLFETLMVLLFIAVLRRMPRFEKVSRATNRTFDAILAVAGGTFVFLLVWLATTTTLHPTISAFHAAMAETAAHGHNVVNVILVDFRGLDTLGEITVLAVAALGVTALLRLRPRKGGEP
jgi:multicomponent Na+:H+ antiporter subunit A